MLKETFAALFGRSRADRSKGKNRKKHKKGQPKQAPGRQTEPFFTVVISSYNSSSRILPTIRSALAQTYRHYEIIVVGDGCTDDTGDVIRANFGNRVRWINLKRNFGSQSWPNNRGIRAARGSHIAYLGHDDIWSPHHLAALAETISASDPDFAVSGAIFHPPEGTDLYMISGLFDDSSAANTQFYPPSSFCHRRPIVNKIGMWGDPSQLRAAVDADLLLRAVAAGCSFASTKRITAHKFAAIQRYLWYRFPSSDEQEAMLDKLADPLFETRLMTMIAERAAVGARISCVRFPDYSKYELGQLSKRYRSAKGLTTTAPVAIERSVRLPLEAGPAALDWQPVSEHSKLGAVRWSGQNPNPSYLVNARIERRFALRIHLAFVEATVLAGMRVKIDRRYTDYLVEQVPDRGVILTVRPDLPLPVENGTIVTFETYRPGTPRPPNPMPAGRLAIAGVEVVLD